MSAKPIPAGRTRSPGTGEWWARCDGRFAVVEANRPSSPTSGRRAREEPPARARSADVGAGRAPDAEPGEQGRVGREHEGSAPPLEPDGIRVLRDAVDDGAGGL